MGKEAPSAQGIPTKALVQDSEGFLEEMVPRIGLQGQGSWKKKLGKPQNSHSAIWTWTW